jgi:hypothetical protein
MSFYTSKITLLYFAKQRLCGTPGMTMDWQGAPASPSSYTVKRILHLEIPVDTFPNVNSYVNSSSTKENYLLYPDNCLLSFLKLKVRSTRINLNILPFIALVQFCWKASGT